MITITHTAADGTLVEGTTREVAPIIKSVGGFRWSRNLGAWYVPQSRDRIAQTHRIDTLAERLRTAGHDVTVTIDNHARATAEVEADRTERAHDRSERLADRAERKSAASNAAWETSRAMSDMIPFGQPILVGHHSERRHRRTLDRIDRLDRKAFELGSEAREDARRAEVAVNHDAYRKSVPVTLRRIEKLEAELRAFDRRIAQSGRDQMTGAGKTVGQWRDETAEQIEYWRGKVAEAEANGFKVWTRADFAKGDLVRYRHGGGIVRRVNAKSVTISHPIPQLREAGHTWTVSYDEVTGRVPAAELNLTDEQRAAL